MEQKTFKASENKAISVTAWTEYRGDSFGSSRFLRVDADMQNAVAENTRLPAESFEYDAKQMFGNDYKVIEYRLSDADCDTIRGYFPKPVEWQLKPGFEKDLAKVHAEIERLDNQLSELREFVWKFAVAKC